MKRVIVLMMIFLTMFSFKKVDASENLIVNGKAGLLMEANSGEIIFEKNKDERLAVASMTKMVGLIIIMEKIENKEISLDDIVTASKNASGMGGSQIYLETGEKMTVRDLIKGITMASANDATVAMAEYIAGTEEKFVEMMNEKVKSLGLVNTNFVNVTGLDEDNHYSSGYDMAMIARELLKHEMIYDFTSVYEDYLRVNTDNKFWLVNTNRLVNLYEGADGLKTGFTDAAGYCMAVTAKRGNMRLIAIVLGEEKGSVRNEETAELLDYGFNNYKVINLKEKDSVVDSIKFEKSTINNVNIYLERDASVLMKNSDNENGYDTLIEIDNIKLPLSSNDIVGKFLIKKNGSVIDEITLIVKDSVKAKNFFQLFIDILKNTLYI